MVVSRRVTSLLNNLPNFDHRLIGLRQKLFFFDELSQGSCFFEPRGAHIYNKLVSFLRKEYKERKYEEVITPNIYSCQLWETSGHWKHYQKNMIKFNISEKEYSLKPMNCPGHCLMFKQQGLITSDQLPIRWADFGVLHRNELSGSLIGLTRVRRFQQDDAHIFCTLSQVELEVSNCLQFARQVYEKFNFDFYLELSLRPQNFMGVTELWDKAENSLRKALTNSGLEWNEHKFEGAFYGPKIDLIVKDCHNRSHQCATIQLDFQLPERFELIYKDVEKENELQRPVMIHRAILGSLERFIAMIAESCSGRWPFWLSPLQAQVIPIHPNIVPYAKQISDILRAEGFWVDYDSRTLTLNGKVREASLLPYNIILIVGQKEIETNTVTCRLEYNPSVLNKYVFLCKEGGDEDIEVELRGGLVNIHINEMKRELENKKIVRNIRMSVEKLIELFREFEKREVDRADLELLRLIKE